MNPLEETIRNNCPPLAPLPTGAVPKLNKLGPVKAVLFDVYGTLFVSGSGDVGTAAATNTAEALTKALAASGFEGDLEQAGRCGKDLLKTEIMEWHENARAQGIDFPEVEITRIWKQVVDELCSTETLEHPTINGGIASSLSTDAEDGVPPPAPDAILRLAVEYECRVNPVFPMPESLETIETLTRSGHVLGLVSNAQFYTPLLFSVFFGQTVEECGFDPDCCIWSFEELRAKPSEALFLKLGKFLREKHGIGLGETVYVGNDMLNDICCAKQAGCKTVLFAGDRRSLRLRENDERCLAIQPDAVITSLDQLLEIL